MINVRRATASDAVELVRLRGILLAAMQGREPDEGPWREQARRTLERRLTEAEPTLVAFVVAQPDAPGRLAACAVGTVSNASAGRVTPAG